jgi:ABC-type transport system involved in multi-copper enzyme maturation permease subunit
MRADLWIKDVEGILRSKRTSYSLVIMAALAATVAAVVALSPEGLRNALSAAAPGSSGIFEYLWIEDVLDKLLLLIFVSFGSFAICDLEDGGMIGLSLSRTQSRFEVILRRLTASFVSFLLVFLIGSVIVGLIGSIVTGETDAPLFILHQMMVLPMCLFVFALTFFLSVPLKATSLTAITSFGISLALSFTYSFLLMTGDPIPSELNPIALGYRVLLELPLGGAIAATVLSSLALLGAGVLWFMKKDL